MAAFNPYGEIPEFRRRYRYLVAVVLVSFAVLLGRIFQLQLLSGDRYRRATEENFIQERRLPTRRGSIRDRAGRLLAGTRPSYDVLATPAFLAPGGLERLAAVLELPEERVAALSRRFASLKGRARAIPRLVARDVDAERLARLETRRESLPGVRVVAVARRRYPHGNLLAHLIGYMNEVNARELAADRDGFYRAGDLIGRAGVERAFETLLRGVPGVERVVVDARGRRKRDAEGELLAGGVRRRAPQVGHDITLTIDLDLQRLVERALRRHRSGAAVVLEASTGRVLASASRPSFDPNRMSGRLSVAEARRLLGSPDRPLVDRVVREAYFPASTYKVVPAAAALEEKVVDPDERIVCKGYLPFGRRLFRCSHAHGPVDLHLAIVASCNVYFYKLAELLGMDAMARYARAFGFGEPTGLGINGEVPGFIPTKAWYARRRVPFRVGFTLNAAIGQGNTKATPLQVASAYAAIGNGGKLMLPQVVERIEDAEGRVVQRFSPHVRRRLPVSPENLARIQRALADVVAHPSGTAHGARLAEIRVAGKTGTAQVVRRGRQHERRSLRDHAWFAAYAPAERPRIALAVVIEHGGQAAKVAAPVAMEIIRGYFRYVAEKAPAPGGGR